MLLDSGSIELHTRAGVDSQPLDLTVSRKRESEKSNERKGAATQDGHGGQLFLKLLQQQILLSVIKQAGLNVVHDEGYRAKCEKKKSALVECGEKFMGNKRRSEANARERNRVQHLGDMFERLKSVLPVELDVKISKLATLKIASAYIRYLNCVLDAENVCLLMESEQLLMLRICEARSYPKKP
ncbi:hypothetical protein Q1695_006607 [Nippostrongylus brasiliensis]|nr:hypothetical protein Q1695_006607 [Nippostrongylus brasiliensis]